MNKHFSWDLRGGILLVVAAVLVGWAAAVAGSMGLKWALVPLGILCLPIGAAVLGSVRRLLLGLLVVSICVQVDVNLGYYAGFTTLKLGVPVTLTGLLVLAGSAHLLWKARKGKERVRSFGAVLVPYGAVVAWAGVTALFARSPDRVIHGFPMALEGLLLLWFVGNSIRGEEDARFVMGAMGLAVGLSGGVALAQFLANSTLGLEFLGEMEGWRPGGRYSRVTGLWNNPNNLAFFLSGWIPLLLLGAIWARRTWLRLGCLVSFLLGLTGLVLTQSRGGWVSVVLASGLGLVFLGRRRGGEDARRVYRRALPVVVGVVVLAVPLLPVVIYRVGQDLGSLKGREQLIPPAFRMIESHPLMGVGLDNYRQMVGWYDPNPPTRPDGSPEAVHNIYLQTAAELGVPALVLVLLAIGVALRRGYLGAGEAGGDLGVLGAGALAGLLAVGLHGMGELGTIWHPKFRTIPFLCGVLLAVWAVSGKGERGLDLEEET